MSSSRTREQQQYNVRNPAVKRLMREALELREASELFHAQPLEDNLFEWHFTVRGPPDSDFGGGFYHGRILLPPEYPMKPPSIILLTPNGRFELNKKICLSISGYHPETWLPSWSIRTALLAIQGFMPTHGGGAIGSLDYGSDERRRLAAKSRQQRCPQCCADKALSDLLPPLTDNSKSESDEARRLAGQINFQDEKQHALQVEKANASSNDQNTTAVVAGENEEQESRDEQTTMSSQDQQVEEDGPSEQPASTLNHDSSQSNNRRPAVEPGVRRAQRASSFPADATLLLIFIVVAIISALVFRRLLLINEWRFYSPTTSASDDGGEL